MLDTVLEIGRILRAAPDGLKHHRYIKRAPVYDEKKNPVHFWRIPVNEEGSFDFSQIEQLDDENRQKRLFYLNYKQSDADSTKPYLYGDIYRTVTKTGEDGNFRFGDSAKKSWMALNSFQRAENIAALATDRVKKFRESFRLQNDAIETFLKDHRNIYIHFDFSGRCWYELEELEILNKGLLNTFYQPTKHGFILQAFLYKTLGTSSGSTTGFADENRYKNRVFTTPDQAMDLLYGINYASRSMCRAFDVKIVVLPRGESLSSQQIERFFDRTSTIDSDTEIGEDEVRSEVKDNNAEILEIAVEDELFKMLTDDPQTRSIAQFDFIFCKSGGTKADTDMIELAGLERSNLSYIREHIKTIRLAVEAERIAFQLLLYGKPPQKPLKSLSVMRSFLNILTNKTRSEKKYQAHLYKTLPQIYTESYHHDAVLLPAFIERTEANIRSGDSPNYNLLKFDFYFLTRIQTQGEKHLMNLQHSSSYHVGLLLGKLARGLRSKINSFDKNYAGLLSRRIGSINDVMNLQNEFNQKLIMHYQGPWWSKITDELSGEVKNFEGRYDKNECAFGFFESYFAPRVTEDDTEDSSITNLDSK